MSYPVKVSPRFVVWFGLVGVFLAGGQLPAQVSTISGESTCGTCRISLDARTRLEPDPILGQVQGWPRAALGVGGLVFVTSDLQPRPGADVYGQNGIALGFWEVTNSRSLITRIATGWNGELFLQDISAGIQVLGPGGEVRRSLPGVPTPITNLVVVGDSVLAVVGGERPLTSPDRAVHLYSSRNGRLLRGLGPKEDLRPNQAPGTVSLAPSGDSAVWMVHPPNRISQWGLAGPRLREWVWDPAWLKSVGEEFESVRADEGYVIHDVWEEPRGEVLWVLSVVDDPGHSGARRPRQAEGQPLPPDFFDPSRLNSEKTTILTAVDLRRGKVLAHHSFDESAYEFLRDGRVLVMGKDPDGSNAVELLSFLLSRD